MSLSIFHPHDYVDMDPNPTTKYQLRGSHEYQAISTCQTTAGSFSSLENFNAGQRFCS
jgi:hypothetical protein